MSVSFSKSQDVKSKGSYAYTTLSNIRNVVGITSAQLSDARALQLIDICSKYINLITGQWFEPKRLIKGFPGMGSPFLNLFGVAPLINLNSIEILRERTLGHDHVIGTFSPSSRFYDGTIEERYISIDGEGRSIQNALSDWPVGTSNILVNGWFGWLEEPKFLDTVCGSGISSGTTSVTLGSVVQTPPLTFGEEEYDSVTGTDGFDNAFRERDIVIFVGNNGRELARRQINTVDYTTNTITFDALPFDPIATISSGTRVITYGAVPRLIEFACNKLIEDTFDSTALAARGIKSEKTDHYQYVRFTSLESGGPSYDEISSSPVVNNILQHFAEPGFVSM